MVYRGVIVFIYLIIFFLVRSPDFRTDIADAAADPASIFSVQKLIYQFYYVLQIKYFRGFIFSKFRENKTLGKDEPLFCLLM